MINHKVQRKSSSTGAVEVTVALETTPRFIAGSKWEVVASSLKSLLSTNLVGSSRPQPSASSL